MIKRRSAFIWFRVPFFLGKKTLGPLRTLSFYVQNCATMYLKGYFPVSSHFLYFFENCLNIFCVLTKKVTPQFPQCILLCLEASRCVLKFVNLSQCVPTHNVHIPSCPKLSHSFPNCPIAHCVLTCPSQFQMCDPKLS